MDYTGKQKWKVKEDIDDIVGIDSCDVLFFDALNEAIRCEIERVGKTMDEKDGS